MAREAKVTLDGVDYTVPALNIGQLQEVSAVITGGAAAVGGFDILKIALRRATPKADLETIAPTMDEVGAFVQEVLKLSGLQKPDANPPVA